MSRETGDLRYEVHLLDKLAELASRQGDDTAARSLWGQALSLNEALRDLNFRGPVLYELSLAAHRQGDLEAARSCLEESLAISRECEWFWLEVAVPARLGLVALDQGDPEAARAHFVQALAISHETGLVALIGLEPLACLAAALGKADQAARLWGAIAARSEARGSLPGGWLHFAYRAEQDRWQTVARETLGVAAFEAALAEGRALTLEQAVEYALSTV